MPRGLDVYGQEPLGAATDRDFFFNLHRDDRLRNEIEKHLATLKRDGVIRPWRDRALKPGRGYFRKRYERYAVAMLYPLSTRRQ